MEFAPHSAVRAVLWLATLLAIGASGGGMAVRAQTLPDPDTEIAQRRFRKGAAYYAVRDYDHAVAEFEAARRVKPSPELDFNIARCRDRLDQPGLAIEAYERYLDARPNAPDAPELRKRVEVLRTRLRSYPETGAGGSTPYPPASASDGAVGPRGSRSPADSAEDPRSAAFRASDQRASGAVSRGARVARPYLAPGLVLGGALALAVVGAALVGSVDPAYDNLVARWSDPLATQPARVSMQQEARSLELRANFGYAFFALAGAVAVVDVALWAVAAKRARRVR